jgi:hypothetical protein
VSDSLNYIGYEVHEWIARMQRDGPGIKEPKSFHEDVCDICHRNPGISPLKIAVLVKPCWPNLTVLEVPKTFSRCFTTANEIVGSLRELMPDAGIPDIILGLHNVTRTLLGLTAESVLGAIAQHFLEVDISQHGESKYVF